MIEKLVLPEVCELIATGDFRTLNDVLSGWAPGVVAGLIAELGDDAERLAVLRALGDEQAGRAFGQLDLSARLRLLHSFDEQETARLILAMNPDDRTALLARLPSAMSEHFLSVLPPQERSVAEGLLSYKEGTVGRLMTPNFVALRHDWTVARSLEHIRTVGRRGETLNVLYVVDGEGNLIDDIRLSELILASPEVPISEVMNRQFVALRVGDDREVAVGLFRRYGRTALPVIDDRGNLVGIVTIDDVLDVAEQRATEELQRFGGLEALEDSYTGTSTLVLVRKRAYWLVILFIGEMLTATAMGFYEREIEKAVVLALFVPLIISSGGNSGSQAATLIIRAMALGEVKLRDWWHVMRRELLSGAILGGILGTIGFLRIGIWSAFSTIYGPHWALVGLTVGLSLVGIVVWGTLAGSMLPFILKRIGLDPATSSAPFVATLVDVTGLIIYFTVAVVVLRGTLL